MFLQYRILQETADFCYTCFLAEEKKFQNEASSIAILISTYYLDSWLSDVNEMYFYIQKIC